MDDKSGICVVSYPILKAFSTPLSNLEKILSTIYNKVYIINGAYEQMDILPGNNTIIYSIRHKASKNLFIKIMRYALLQAKVCLKIIKIIDDVDTFIFFMEYGAFFPMLLCKLCGKKVYYMLPSSINITNKINKDPIIKLMLRIHDINYIISDYIIVYSKNIIDEWGLKKYENKICISHEHSVDLNKFCNHIKFDERELLIGYVGRLSEEKGIRNFIESIPLIIKQYPEARFIIVGNGSLLKNIQDILENENLINYVEFTGWVSHEDLPKYLNQIKIQILPSYTEGLPNVILEGMACGTIIIATNVGAIPDIIINNKTGFILENNSPEAISSKVVNVLNNDALKDVSSNAIKAIEESFSLISSVKIFRYVLNSNDNIIYRK